ncbi:hypothetical protein PG997_005099 [Apiospora hydei]|uniref:Uncharacterized protein n=1 Tax=Apiospora hydei TaxID=1337664 RepID=A0ABR1X409_9PEZI
MEEDKFKSGLTDLHVLNQHNVQDRGMFVITNSICIALGFDFNIQQDHSTSTKEAHRTRRCSSGNLLVPVPLIPFAEWCQAGMPALV